METMETKHRVFLEANPALANALEEYRVNASLHADNRFAADVVGAFVRYGSLSVKQIDALVNSLATAKLRAAGLSEPKGTAPVGRQTVTGIVVSLKEKDTAYGPKLKMTVKLDNNSKVWATVPRGAVLKVGDSITFTATFRHADGDPSFAFGSRSVLGGEVVAYDIETTGTPIIPVPRMAPKVEPAEPVKPTGPSVLEQLLAEL
jgi:hypothetical protein